ncbi:MAG: recombinase family protein [Clostridium sartagoforme]|nr:recombinase family protein [Clostridium sartagoforme]
MLVHSTLRACGYIRVSTNHPKQQSSLENQKKQILQYITKNNFSFIDIYDDIKSGTISNRDGLNRLKNHIKKDVFDVIIVKDISRLTRDTSTASDIKKLLTTHKKHLIALDDSINTILDYNSISKLISKAQFHEDESRALSNRMKNSKLDNCYDGKFNGSTPPYGYYLKNFKLIKRDDISPFIVKRIFAEFIGGKSFTQIAKGLNKDKIQTPSQLTKKSNATSQWRDTTVRGILNNISYCGHLLQHKTIPLDLCDKRRQSVPEEETILVENTHEAIISIEQFELVKKKLASKISNKTRQSTYLYSNVLYCMDCGSKMHKRTSPKGEKYYICGTANKISSKLCSRNTIKENYLTNMIVENLNNYISTNNINVLNKSITKYVEDLVKSLKKSYKDCIIRIEMLEKQKADVISFFPTYISQQEYDCYIKVRNDEISKLEVEKLKYRTLINKISIKELIKLVTDIKNKSISIENFNSEILNIFVSKIEFSKKKTPKIYYNCNNSSR